MRDGLSRVQKVISRPSVASVSGQRSEDGSARGPATKTTGVSAIASALQSGQSLSLPHSRPMPSIGKRCHELRIVDEDVTWRFFYRIDADCIVLIHWEQKKTRRTLKATIDLCKARLAAYDD
ncbi:type II toxin-antitoxin system RelE/ParE family toxin [Desulfonatronum lacustre]|uniref:type II toxin-antitoxin system RelE/ParE family toxin n=1 Tax=Desulfonatronum lacustre TaxID=66849 RepID=UPI0033902416